MKKLKKIVQHYKLMSEEFYAPTAHDLLIETMSRARSSKENLELNSMMADLNKRLDLYESLLPNIEEHPLYSFDEQLNQRREAKKSLEESIKNISNTNKYLIINSKKVLKEKFDIDIKDTKFLSRSLTQNLTDLKKISLLNDTGKSTILFETPLLVNGKDFYPADKYNNDENRKSLLVRNLDIIVSNYNENKISKEKLLQEVFLQNITESHKEVIESIFDKLSEKVNLNKYSLEILDYKTVDLSEKDSVNLHNELVLFDKGYMQRSKNILKETYNINVEDVEIGPDYYSQLHQIYGVSKLLIDHDNSLKKVTTLPTELDKEKQRELSIDTIEFKLYYLGKSEERDNLESIYIEKSLKEDPDSLPNLDSLIKSLRETHQKYLAEKLIDSLPNKEAKEILLKPALKKLNEKPEFQQSEYFMGTFFDKSYNEILSNTRNKLQQKNKIEMTEQEFSELLFETRDSDFPLTGMYESNKQKSFYLIKNEVKISGRTLYTT